MKNIKKAISLLLVALIAVPVLGLTAFAGLVENNTAAGTVLWAGYEEYNGSTSADTIYVIAKKGADNTPSKVQIRSSVGTMTFVRKNDNVAISDVTYEETACELWTISNRTLPYDSYLAVAKYVNVPLADIPAADGAAFTVAKPQVPAASDSVYSAEISGLSESGKIVFDGVTTQTVTIKTGVDVVKVQLQTNDAAKHTMTYNSNNAVVTEGTFENEPCLVWTITRLFGKGEYDYLINVRTLHDGLKSSSVHLEFDVVAPPIAKLVSATVAYPQLGKAVFTVVTADNASKVKFTNTDDKGTITIKEGHAWASVDVNEDGTKTWTITLSFAPGMEFNYNIAACVGSYSAPINLDVKMPKA